MEGGKTAAIVAVVVVVIIIIIALIVWWCWRGRSQTDDDAPCYKGVDKTHLSNLKRLDESLKEIPTLTKMSTLETNSCNNDSQSLLAQRYGEAFTAYYGGNGKRAAVVTNQMMTKHGLLIEVSTDKSKKAVARKQLHHINVQLAKELSTTGQKGGDTNLIQLLDNIDLAHLDYIGLQAEGRCESSLKAYEAAKAATGQFGMWLAVSYCRKNGVEL